MILYTLAFLGGVLTIASPCVLPVVPFVFARVGEPFRRSGLPTLVGMAVTFAVVASAATLGGGWLVQTHRFGRYAALVLMAVLGVALVVPAVAERLARPLVRVGGWLQGRSDSPRAGAFVAGVAIGCLWAPCAGPILGLLLTGAALGGPSAGTALLLLAFATGAVLALGVLLVAGGGLINVCKRRLGAEAHMRRILGVLVLAGVTAIAMGWDTGILARLTLVDTASAEQALVDRMGGDRGEPPAGESLDAFVARENEALLGDEGEMPELAGATGWINSSPLNRAALRGKVVLIDFWTFGCYNCLNALPHVKELHAKYADQGLVVIGVHTPEFARERDRGNVERAVRRLGVTYPVAMDNEYRIWKAFHNRYWPAAYYVDAAGQIRFHHFGEGRYAEQERVVQALLAEAKRSAPGVAFRRTQPAGRPRRPSSTRASSSRNAQRTSAPAKMINEG